VSEPFAPDSTVDAPRLAVIVLAVSTLTLIGASLAWAWLTFDYWDGLPLLLTVPSVGLLAASTLYSSRRRLGRAIVCGAVAATATGIATLMITIVQWDG
jgi:hypothetical protein